MTSPDREDEAQASIPMPTRAPRPHLDRSRREGHRQHIAVIIPAKDEAILVGRTVRSARTIPGVDIVLVVDDGSTDNTQDIAREAGAVVVRHPHNRGKSAAMETGASVIAMRDVDDRPARLLLFLDADLGSTAVNVTPLIEPVISGQADVAIANLPAQPDSGEHGLVVTTARRAIKSLGGWHAEQPLSGIRCMTRSAFEAATPLTRGWGVEVGMTIDLLRQGFQLVEVPCNLRHRPASGDLGGQLHRAAKLRDVQLAIGTRRVRSAGSAVGRGFGRIVGAVKGSSSERRAAQADRQAQRRADRDDDLL